MDILPSLCSRFAKILDLCETDFQVFAAGKSARQRVGGVS